MPPDYPDTPAVREELARMYDNIADMDTQVGQILKQLEDDGLSESTIVLIGAIMATACRGRSGR